MGKKLDKFDIKILRVLQSDGRITNQKLAERVDLSTAPCWRRLNRLEHDGLIDNYVALVNPEKIGLTVTVYIHIQLNDHHSQTVDQFHQFVDSSDAILESYTVSGEYDYLLKVIAKDVQALEIFLMEKLLKLQSVRSANTSFVLKRMKYKTALPIHEG